MNVDLPLNDIRVIAHNPILAYTQVPTCQTPGLVDSARVRFPDTLRVQAFNAGLSPQTNIMFSARLNNTINLGTAGPVATLASMATTEPMFITTPTGISFSAEGVYSITYRADQAEIDITPEDNEITLPLITFGGDIYAVDATELAPGVGAGWSSPSAPQTNGNIFEIFSTTVLTQVMVGFNNNISPGRNIALHRMTGESTIEITPIFRVPVADHLMGVLTIDVPTTVLLPGRYYLCAEQTSSENFRLSFDDRPGSLRGRTRSITGTTLGNSSNGTPLIRMVVDADFPMLSMSLSPTGTHEFPQRTAGYASAPAALEVTITNTGNRPTGEISVSLTGTHAADFEITGNQISNIAMGETARFSVRPKVGLEAGTYTAEALITGGSPLSGSVDFRFTVAPGTSIMEIEDLEALKLYPNPVTDGKLFIELPESAGNNPLLQIYDFNGRQVMTRTLHSATTEVDVSHLSNGTYVVRIGQFTAKIVVAKF